MAGVDAAFDGLRVLSGERRMMQSGASIARRRDRRTGRRRARLVFRRAPAQGRHREILGLRRRRTIAPADAALGDYVTYPIFNKYGAVNLGEVAGGVRLLWTESVAGVINWAIAAPLFSFNFVLLASLLERSLTPIRNLLSEEGLEGLVEQTVRVMRWGLWMSPIINSFLRQSPDPSWYNQDGAVRPSSRSAPISASTRRLSRLQPDDILRAARL